MYKSRSNVFLAGIVVAYLVLFFIQFFSPYMLPIRLYAKVAVVSLALAIAELVKSCTVRVVEISLDYKQHLKGVRLCY